tara:strand:+ start:509 stop:688 length:180 start_codon:yes stop_codon:yes gene_type:complete
LENQTPPQKGLTSQVQDHAQPQKQDLAFAEPTLGTQRGLTPSPAKRKKSGRNYHSMNHL